MEKAVEKVVDLIGIDEIYVGDQLRLITELVAGEIKWSEFYQTSYPFTSVFSVCMMTAVAVIILGFITEDYSWVDRLWSIYPTFIILSYAYHAYINDISNARLILYVAIVLIWGIRLTCNFARKGGYSGTEDYRWEVLRKLLPPTVFQVFSILFIGFIQMGLLAAITSPGCILYESADIPLRFIDLIFAASILGFIVIETIADNQMWNFQQAKTAYKQRPRKGKGKTLPAGYSKAQLERGFCTNGLFKYSRHSNFFSEQMIWGIPYLWGAVVTQRYLNWTIIGPVLYVILFTASTLFTEYITASKYPEYVEYQATVGRFVPNLGSHWIEPSTAK
ncbi:uncharacterized protein V1516DRAFT_675600 [Lipomyces oligophaga]|uniref:uncharacterized protein n=1 Tax=Lipomyces oligophaga TaxID=45792 RepID=UPI0034CEA22E